MIKEIVYKDHNFTGYKKNSENGEITNVDGVIQKVNIYNGHLFFKRVPVHRIQASTWLGYKKNYDVHHKDFNPFNNNIKNLVYLTRSEHIRLHNLFRNYSYMQGENNPAYNKHWWINVNTQERILCKDCPGDGWINAMKYERV